jgi:hypothetical protein
VINEKLIYAKSLINKIKIDLHKIYYAFNQLLQKSIIIKLHGLKIDFY